MHSLFGIQKWEQRTIKDNFVSRKSPRNYPSSHCDCFQLNWSSQSLHLAYNLHGNRQECHSLPSQIHLTSVSRRAALDAYALCNIHQVGWERLPPRRMKMFPQRERDRRGLFCKATWGCNGVFVFVIRTHWGSKLAAEHWIVSTLPFSVEARASRWNTFIYTALSVCCPLTSHFISVLIEPCSLFWKDL